MIMFPEGRERLRALGYYTAVSIGGGAIGLILGGLLVQVASWRWVLFVNVPVGLVVLVLARRFPDRDTEPQRPLRCAAAR